MTTDWLLRVGDGLNFIRSSKYKIWGIQKINTSPSAKYFIKNVKPGDRLWFVKSNSQGKLIAVATYKSHNERDLGVTMSDEELGWTGSERDWITDMEIHYTDLYGLNDCELLTNIKGTLPIRRYDEKCGVNLAVEYSYIVRYRKAIS